MTIRSPLRRSRLRKPMATSIKCMELARLVALLGMRRGGGLLLALMRCSLFYRSKLKSSASGREADLAMIGSRGMLARYAEQEKGFFRDVWEPGVALVYKKTHTTVLHFCWT